MPAKKLLAGGDASCGCVGGPGMIGGARKAAAKAAKAVGKAARRAVAKMTGGACACEGAPSGAAGAARFYGGFFADPWARLLVLLQFALVALIAWMAWAMWSRRAPASAPRADDEAAAPLVVHHAGYVRGPVAQPPMRGGDIRNAPNLIVNPMRDPAYPLRGVPQDFQQMGTLVSAAPEGAAGAQPTILPLVGRPSPTNRDRWNYYTATDQYNMMRLPVTVDGKDCQEDVGCREIADGDAVRIPAYGKDFTAQVYKYDRPQYNPNGPSTVTLAI